jgi:protocatechuate 3,4-dioxygenase beta subunit
MKAFATATIAVLLFANGSLAQTPAVPPRDKATQAPTGTARIRGRVVAADTGNPIARAQISIYGAEANISRNITTDADGRYDATNMPPGPYRISVSRLGFVTLQFGQTRPFDSGRQLTLASGQSLDRIDFALPRGGVITGRISDHNGEPLPGIQVHPLRYSYGPSGTRQIGAAPSGARAFGGFVTDDLGQFRIYGLMPGSYIISTGPQPGMVAGPEYEGLGPTYYPGTANVGEAQLVTVGVAQEVHAHFALVPSRLARVSGVVVDSRGRPVASRSLNLSTQTDSMMSSRSIGMTRKDGTFEIPSVPPGDYSIDVTPYNARTGLVPSEEFEFASIPISVAGQDISGLTVTTHAGWTVSGRVVFEGTSPRPSARPLSVVPVAADPGSGRLVSSRDADNGRVDADGTFRVTGVNGNVLFSTSLLTAGELWALKSVRLRGADITDIGYNVASDIDGVEVVLTDRRTTLSGVAKDARGEAVSHYVVVVLPTDLKPGTLPSRFVRAINPDQQGRYQATGLPPGSYVAAAVEFLEYGTHYDPSFQKRVRERGTSFTLKEGQQLALDLQLMP